MLSILATLFAAYTFPGVAGRNCSAVDLSLRNLDVNGDGIISNTELYSVARFCGGSLNFDHGCNTTELVSACFDEAKVTHKIVSPMQVTIASSDISISLAASAESCNATKFRSLLQSYDVNNDGAISNEEIPYIARLCPTETYSSDALDDFCLIENLIELHCKQSALTRRDATTQTCIICTAGKNALCGGKTVDAESCVCQGQNDCVEEGWCTATCCGLNNGFCVAGCFPADAEVIREGGVPARMDQLQVGDKVLVGYANKKPVYEEIYMFGHDLSNVRAQFVRISLVSVTGSLDLTPDHFIPVYDRFEKFTYVRAGSLIPGMLILTTNSGLQAVHSVKFVNKEGLFNPYTLSGRIIVNSIQVSSHSSSFLDKIFDFFNIDAQYLPDTYQAIFLPARVAYFMLGKTNFAVAGNYMVRLVNRMIEVESWSALLMGHGFNSV
ncbi:hypothetical protein HDU84_005933 [Entophlyctis sp. JEL0112]|nr:hypothetical protein HDU84_005933 [Entophlyctis sp. JEL0112]